MTKDVALTVRVPNEDVPRKIPFLAPPSILLGLFSSALLYFGLFAPGRLLNSVFDWFVETETDNLFNNFNFPEVFHNANVEFNQVGIGYDKLIQKTNFYQLIIDHVDFIKKDLSESTSPDFISNLNLTFSKLTELYQTSLVTTQDLNNSKLFEYLDDLSRQEGYALAQNQFASIPFFLSSQFTMSQGVLDYRQEFLKNTFHLVRVSDEQFWSTDLKKVVVYTYIPFANMTSQVKSINYLASVSKKTFRELFILMQDAYDAYSKTTPGHPTLQDSLRTELKITAQSIIDKWVVLGHGTLAALIEFYFIRVLGLYTSFFSPDQPVEFKDAIAYRTLLLLNLIFIPWLIYKIWNHYSAIPEMVFLGQSSALALAIPSLNRRVDKYMHSTVQQTLEAKQTLLVEAMPDDNPDVMLHLKKLGSRIPQLEDYEFDIRIKKYKNLNGFLMFQIVHEAFLMAKFTITALDLRCKSLSVAANSLINKELITSIQKHIKKNTDKALDSTRLFEQIVQVNRLLSKADLEYEAYDQYIYQYTLSISNIYKPCIEKIKQVFNLNLIESHELVNEHLMFISGSKPACEQEFSALIAALRVLKLGSLDTLVVYETKSETRVPRRKSLPESKPTPRRPTIPAITKTEPTYPIEWPSAKYDPNNPSKPTVWPFNPPGLPINTFFICRTFKKEDFLNPNWYKHAKEKLKRAHWVRDENSNEQGIVLLHSDPQGFFAKERLLGDDGDVRPNAKDEVSATGKILINFFLCE